jgi:hypothetical protein
MISLSASFKVNSQCVDFDLVGPATLCNPLTTTYSYSIVGNLGCPNGTWQTNGTNTILNQTATTIDILWGSTPGQWVAYVDGSSNFGDTIFLQPCCMEPNVTNLTDYSFIKLVNTVQNFFPQANYQISPLGSNTYILKLYDVSFAINGLFFIESGNKLELYGCDVRMGPGAQIKLQRFSQAGISLLPAIANTTIKASSCNTMWRGIYLGEGTTYDAERATVKDAQYAVSVNQKCFINSINSNYENNYVSFHYPSVNGIGNNAMHNSDNLEANIFKSPNLINPYTSQSPIPAGKTLTAILCHNMNIQQSSGAYGLKFNTTNSNPNTFIGLNCGIACYDSYADIFNCKFERMEYVPAYSNYPFSGYSISGITTPSLNPAISPEINISDENTLANTKFVEIESSYSGIYLSGNNSNKVSSSLITCAGYGINQSLNTLGYTEIVNNTINGPQFGISIQELSNSFSYVKIVGNRITGSSLGYSEGISVYNSFPFKITTNISENRIYDYSKGITLFKLYKGIEYFLNFNEISISYSDFSSGLQTGIHLSDVKGIFSDGNIIICSGTDPSLLNTYANNLNGFLMQNTFDSEFYNNHVETFGTGIKLAFNCTNTYFHCNSLTDCYPSFRFHEVYLSNQLSACNPNYTSFITNFDPNYLRFEGNILSPPILWFYNSGSTIEDPFPYDPTLIIPTVASRDCLPSELCNRKDEEKTTDLTSVQNSAVQIVNLGEGYYIINAGESVVKEMEVIDLLGRTLFQSTLNSVQPQVKLPDLNNGIYFVKVRFDDNSSAATRMFIQK